MKRTLASSNTLNGLENLIKEHFFGTEYKCQENGKIVDLKGKVLNGFYWCKLAKRYYFKRDV